MPASIGVNLRVTGHCRQGGRKYMEDFFSVAYQQTEDEKDLEYAFFGIYDGHGGGEAATFAKEHLMESIVRQKNFWSDKDEDVLKAIKEGYISTHYAMWKEQEKWPKTASGLPSTAGTTASVAFIRRGKIYIGHVGDSGIILGYQEPGNSLWKARPLTKDHKPENASEMSRIESCGGKVVTKSGVPRVVWNRPRIGHKGPVRRSTPIDEIPFLAVARSLGDLWSYNSALDEFVVSPDPDTCCIPIDCDSFRCLIFGTDGLWNMISPSTAVNIVQVAEQHNEKTVLAGNEPQAVNDPSQQTAAGRTTKVWINPSKCLVERALERWSSTRMRADNTSVITLMLDPPGPPRAEVIKNQRLLQERSRLNQLTSSPEGAPPPDYPKNGLEIVTMYGEEPATSKTEETTQQMQDLQMSPNGAPLPGPELEIAPDVKNKKYTEEYLDKVHQEVLDNQEEVTSAEDAAPVRRTPLPLEKDLKIEQQLQSNEVSSSSPEKVIIEESPPCARCTRSHDTKRPPKGEALPLKSGRSSSESPKRKTRPLKTTNRRTIAAAKREHSDPDISRGEALDSSRLAPGPSVEPPQKLRRSRSLGPRDFTLRSAGELKNVGRCLRDRDRALGGPQSRHSLLNSFRKLSTNQNRSYTPVRQAIQTRNRLKRLNNK